MSRSLHNRAAICGIGQTEFSKESGRSELQLASEAAKAALDDAGLQPRDVDGMVTFTMDSSEESALGRNLGIPALTMFSRVPFGGGAACAVVMQAAMAIATGAAEVVLCYRALNERSGMRFGGAGMVGAMLPPWLDWYGPYGLLSPAAWVALHARRYMHAYGVTNEDFGRISVVDRTHAATNPAAWLPINTSGGLLGEAYIHGMNGITEAVRQIRGTSCNQVDGVEHVLVTAGTGCPTSGLILGRE